jgi:hypothetical protein
LIDEAFKDGDKWDTVIASTLSDKELDAEFNNGFGGSEGKPFTLWTENRVYFPVVYDGAEWVGSVPRNPSHEATSHVGRE